MKTKIPSFLIAVSGIVFTKTHAQCNANFQASVSGCTVNFTNTSQGNSTSNWSWNFGDNQSSSVQNPTHTYAASGTYVVCLQFSSPSCNGAYCTSVTVNCNTTGVGDINENGLELVVQNPAVSTTLVQYSLPRSGQVEISLFDLSGNRIAVPQQGYRGAGMHTFNLELGNYSNGVYFLHLNFEGIILTRKMVLTP